MDLNDNVHPDNILQGSCIDIVEHRVVHQDSDIV